MSQQSITHFLNTALECSFYHAPREPGLTYDELLEIGKRAGYLEGEIGDAFSRLGTQHFGGNPNRRLLPNPHMVIMWGTIAIAQNPDFRNVEAYDFIYSEMNAVIRAMGGGRAQLDRSVIVERGVQHGIPRLDIESAITIMVVCGQLSEKDGQLRSPSGQQFHPPASQQRNQMLVAGRRPPDESRQRAYEIVRDIVGRRSDGRLKYAEPFDAFADALNQLSRTPFRLWWTQMVAELRRCDAASSPVSVLVLSAALVEGALAFVVKHARDLGLGVFASKDFHGNPRTWKIDDLVSSAASGRDTAILDGPTRQRADELIRNRQRIHAGRMLSEFPGGVPDLRPDEAREAKTTAEQVVRRVLDWLEKFPPTAVGATKP